MNRNRMLVGAAVFLVSALMFALASYNAGALPTLAYGLWLMRICGLTRAITIP